MNKRKQRLYLDTSVISNIDAPHAPDLQRATWGLFDFAEEHADEYELALSPMVELEINNAPKSKQTIFTAFLKTLKHVVLPEDPEVGQLVQIYIENNVLSDRHLRDLTHVAYAVVGDCNSIVSWNFKHLANQRTIHRVNAVNQIYNYRPIEIVTPPNITGENLYDFR